MTRVTFIDKHFESYQHLELYLLIYYRAKPIMLIVSPRFTRFSGHKESISKTTVMNQRYLQSNLMVHSPWTIIKAFQSPVITFRSAPISALWSWIRIPDSSPEYIYYWNDKISIQRISLTDQTWRNTIRIWKLRA